MGSCVSRGEGAAGRVGVGPRRSLGVAAGGRPGLPRPAARPPAPPPDPGDTVPPGGQGTGVAAQRESGGRSPHLQPGLEPHPGRGQEAGSLPALQPHAPCRVLWRGGRLLAAPGFSGGQVAAPGKAADCPSHTPPRHRPDLLSAPTSVPLPPALSSESPHPIDSSGLMERNRLYGRYPFPHSHP